MKIVVDRVVQYSNRYKLTNVSTGAVLGTFDFDEVTGTVQEVGTEIDKELFDSIADDLAARLVANGGDSKDVVVTFTEATTLENIASGEKHSTIFGKLKKWIADRISKLKAFTYDVNTKITTTDTDSTIPSTKALEDGDITVMNAEFASSASRATADKNGKDITTYVAVETDPTVPAWAKAQTKPLYTKAEIGLGNVDNTADEDKPISTATQNALSGKVDKVSGKQLSTNDYTTNEKNKLSGLATDTVRYGVQTLSDAQKAQARTNIGAGTSSFDGTWRSLQGKPGVVQTTGTSASDIMSQKATTDALNTVQGKIPTKVSQLTNDSGYATQSAVNAKYTKPSDGIPAEDLEESIQASLAKADSALQSAPVTSVNGKTGAVSLKATDVGALPSDTKYVSSVNGSTGAITEIATKAEVNAKQNTLTTEQLAAVNSGITADKVKTYDSYKVELDKKANDADLAVVAKSGSYNSLTDKPTIPDVSGKANLSGGNDFSGNQVITGYLDIRGTAADKHLKTRGIGGSDGNGNEQDLYLQYGSDYKTFFGKTAQSSLNSDGSISINGKKAATVDQIPTDTGMTSVEVTGAGNAVTGASYNASTRKLSLTKNTTFASNTLASTTTNGLMSAADKTKLNGIEAEANKTVIDSALSGTSTNPVQNKAIKAELDKKANTSDIPSTDDFVKITGDQDVYGAKNFRGGVTVYDSFDVDVDDEILFRVRKDENYNHYVDIGSDNVATELRVAGEAGTTGQVLTSQGANSTPKWVTPTGGGGAVITLTETSGTLSAADLETAKDVNTKILYGGNLYTNTGTPTGDIFIYYEFVSYVSAYVIYSYEVRINSSTGAYVANSTQIVGTVYKHEVFVAANITGVDSTGVDVGECGLYFTFYTTTSQTITSFSTLIVRLFGTTNTLRGRLRNPNASIGFGTTTSSSAPEIISPITGMRARIVSSVINITFYYINKTGNLANMTFDSNMVTTVTDTVIRM